MSLKSLKNLASFYERLLPDAIVTLKSLGLINFDELDSSEIACLVKYCDGQPDSSAYITISTWDGVTKNWTKNWSISLSDASEIEAVAEDMANAHGEDAYEIILINSEGEAFQLEAKVRQVNYKLTCIDLL